MSERYQPREIEMQKPIPEAIHEIFERRATKGERKLIMETYQAKLDTLIQTMPKQEQGNVAIQIQKVLVTIRSFFGEYGARFTDYVRKVFLWPMLSATKDFPMDKYYQIELARAKAWGEFGMDTTKTATAERNAYRDHFLSSVMSHAGVGGTILGAAGLVGGAIEGAKIGTVVGLGVQGAVAGAVVGGALGGIYSAGLYFKDKIMGPPVMYYDLFANAGRRGSSIEINNARNVPASIPGMAA